MSWPLPFWSSKRILHRACIHTHTHKGHTHTHTQRHARNMLAGQRSTVLAVRGLRRILWDHPAQHAYRRAVPGHQPKRDVYLLAKKQSISICPFHWCIGCNRAGTCRWWRTTRASMKRTKYWWISNRAWKMHFEAAWD